MIPHGTEALLGQLHALGYASYVRPLRLALAHGVPASTDGPHGTIVVRFAVKREGAAGSLVAELYPPGGGSRLLHAEAWTEDEIRSETFRLRTSTVRRLEGKHGPRWRRAVREILERIVEDG